MRHDGLTRVNFHDRQFLRPQDFVAEQIYHLIGHRRHNVGSHTWGIVAGLTLTEQEGSVYVEPGMAVDGYGRDLVVSRRIAVRTQTFDERLTSALRVWLIFGQDGAEGAPPGFGCVEPDDKRGRAHNGDSADVIPPALPLAGGADRGADGRPDGHPTARRARWGRAADVPFGPYRAFPAGDEPWGVFSARSCGPTPASRRSTPSIWTTGLRRPGGLAGPDPLGPGGSS